jgi:hypothetical protein
VLASRSTGAANRWATSSGRSSLNERWRTGSPPCAYSVISRKVLPIPMMPPLTRLPPILGKSVVKCFDGGQRLEWNRSWWPRRRFISAVKSASGVGAFSVGSPSGRFIQLSKPDVPKSLRQVLAKCRIAKNGNGVAETARFRRRRAHHCQQRSGLCLLRRSAARAFAEPGQAASLWGWTWTVGAWT